MRAYGHEVGNDSSEKESPEPVSLREVTLVCNAEDLDRIRSFVTDVIAKAEAPGGASQEHQASWREDESSLIIWFDSQA